MKRRKLTPVEYAREILEPALAARLDRAFPEFGFKPGTDNWWKAATAPPAFDDYGAAEGKLTATNWGLRSFKAGRVPVAWFAYLNSGLFPTGQRYVEVLKELAARVGLDCRELRDSWDEKDADRARVQQHRAALLEQLLVVTKNALFDSIGEGALAYLEGRGFTRAEIEALDLGFFPSAGHARDALLAAGFTVEDVAASYVLQNPGWDGRVVGAWRDPSGRIGQFFARDLTGKCEASSKYLYLSIDGWARQKQELVLFGIDVVRREVAKGKILDVVEGPLASLYLRKSGILAAAVGGSLSEFSTAKWQALERLQVRRVRVMGDNDRREDGRTPGRDGLIAAVRNFQKSRTGIAVFVVDPSKFENVKGPDDFVQVRGVEEFRNVLDGAEPAAVFQGTELLKGVTPASAEHEKRAAIERVADYVERDLRGDFSDLDADIVLTRASERTGYSKDSLATIIDAAERRGRREQCEKDLDAALREAAAARAKGADAGEIAADLGKRMSMLQHAEEHEPAPFSVDRLLAKCAAAPPGLKTGLAALDGTLELRLYPGDLTGAFGRTGHCKTTMQVSVFFNNAKDLARAGVARGGRGVILFYSCEEPEERVFQRLVVLAGAELGFRWTVNQVRSHLRGEPSPVQPDGFRRAVDFVRCLEPYLDVIYSASWDVDAIAGHALRQATRRDVVLVLADYIQRIRAPGKHDRRDIEVSAVARRLKLLAVELDAPVFAGGQINRDAVRNAKDIPAGKPYADAKVQEAIRGRRPELHHVREGGAEQECDQALGILNFAADFAETHEGSARPTLPEVTRVEMALLKSRFGKTGFWVPLAYERAQMRLRDPNGHGEV